MFLATGIPPYLASTYTQPPNTVVWSSPVWTFFPVPADFIQPGTDSTSGSNATPCATCITKRMTTIA
jgi:hypothetical protein